MTPKLGDSSVNRHIFFSVIVIAYKRKEYLLEAVQSILNQDYPVENYEIIVVKAFEDSPIDLFLEEKHIKNIYLDTPPIGKKLCAGLDICKGEVICILEDDDLFTKDKFSQLSTIYSQTEAMVVVNNYKIVDNEGKCLQPDSLIGSGTNENNGKYHVWEYPRYDIIEIFKNNSMLFNSSRMSFHREMVPIIIEVAGKIVTIIDSIIVPLCIQQRKKLASTQEALTLYRVHGENNSIMSNNSETEVEKQIQLVKKQVFDVIYLSRFFINGPFFSFFQLWGAILKFKYAMYSLPRRGLLISGAELARRFLYYDGLSGMNYEGNAQEVIEGIFIRHPLRRYITLNLWLRETLYNFALFPIFFVSKKFGFRYMNKILHGFGKF